MSIMSKTPIEFQIYDWMEDHEEADCSDSEEEGDNQVYIIHTFGRTEDGKSVYMKITDFTPYFYIKLPSNWSMSKAKSKVKMMYNYLISSSNTRIWQNYRSHLINMKVVEKKSPEGFTNGKKFLFAQLIFDNYKAMKSFKYMFEKEKIKIDKDDYNFDIQSYDKDKHKTFPKTIRINKEMYDVTHVIKLKEKCDKYLPCVIMNNTIGLEMYDKFIKYNVYQDKLTIYGVLNKPYAFKTYESNIQPMLRCFHIKDIKGSGWVRIEKYTPIPKMCKETHCDIEISCNWKKVNPLEKDMNAPLRILSYDIECYSHDGEFPQAHRKEDPIIQIGSTYTYIGESTPYRQHIVCLGETAPVENAIVESYKTEREMVKGWINEVINSDCDVITGYNIFYFDESYIHDRCEKILNLANEIKLISKFKNRPCNYRDFKLASAAMGENRIRMYDTPGRIKIDLMKDVQKTFKLDSFKLDNVAATFIRNKINDIEHLGDNIYNLHCVGVEDIFVNDFIHIEQVLDFISDNVGRKYEIIKITGNTLTIKGSDDIKEFLEEEHEEKYTLWWSQAKDDVGPKDIFRLYQGTPEEKSIVAKYCIKDCRLVNLLMNKMQVVTKNIAMSNVCSVPLSFLFTRGQLIKLFSYCMKIFRDEGYVFPVLTKSIEKKPSYEGAIVFDPEPTVEYESLAVKDYASLYPSSMIHKNMSHETMVRDDKYDNLPGIKYFNAQFTESDGTVQYRRFAKLEGEFGIVPKILQNLLGERRAVKKKMKLEKDPFKKMILDAQQLALKITANSLYGGLGADISPVEERDIAACTTSTGQEMLIFAKEYDENVIPQLINGLKYAIENDDENTYNRILDNELKNKDDMVEVSYSDDKVKITDVIKKYVSEDIKDYTFQPIIRYGDTDSIFSSYKFQEKNIQLNHESSYKLWKELIKFSEKLIGLFLPDEYACIWEECHQEYYGLSLIKDVMLPPGPEEIPEPEHFKTILPEDDRFKQFVKKYMEEFYVPWLWTLQNILNNKSINQKVLKEVLDVKLYRHGMDLVRKIRIEPDELTGEKKNSIYETVNDFIKKTLRDYVIQPYWEYNGDIKMTKYKIYKGGKKVTDMRNLPLSIDMGVITGTLVKTRLPYPHDLEYEKTFFPFLILTKKRYVGNKYEFNLNKYKQDYNGIVLKRRDNAPIVKKICGGIINCLINERDPEMAKQYTIDCINKMIRGEYNIKYFITSKTLKMKSSYANWEGQAHVVLADRIERRDPGNAPQSGDRIEYAMIKVPKFKGMKQGDMIETPQYIKDNNLELDYEFYITNQIMKPALQFLELVIPDAKEQIFKPFLNDMKKKREKEEIEAENNKVGRTSLLGKHVRISSN